MSPDLLLGIAIGACCMWALDNVVYPRFAHWWVAVRRQRAQVRVRDR